MIDKLGAGHYQTRDGDPVVILCLDAPGVKSVVGYRIIEEDGTSLAFSIHPDGRFYRGAENPLDIIPFQRKPREVWITEGALANEGGVYQFAFTKPVHLGRPVLFREVMEVSDD